MMDRKRLGKSGGLLVGLLLLILISGVSPGGNGYLLDLLIWVYYLLVFCIGGYLLSASKHWLKVSLCLAIPTFLIGVLSSVVEPSMTLRLVAHSGALLLQALMILVVIKFSLFDETSGEIGRLVAGVCGYLIFALLCANLYGICETVLPGGFHSNDGRPVTEESGTLLYFSLVTLTTLGYGDISPATNLTRTLSALEAVLGSLYLVIFIASLIPRKGGK
ncbi:Ion channel [Rubritalea squalenifaciens DSM 18772]|uniref:Ion channel n=1 Tax=Rubritalea squalenifaciens DSM 18772 TaxID=1123071 RepID=A0A1M6L0N1_9BACT|nr:potassium channel family protein [Rubritalea squalenifaciens]SHJ64770.1 Ion channel [Rubritalea squalenifaciens DSM 18772]